MNVTGCPAHIAVAVASIITDGVAEVFTVIVASSDAADDGDAHKAEEVITTFTLSPFCKDMV